MLNDNFKAHARISDPETSHDAAEFVTQRLRKLQLEVLAFAFERGRAGFTDPQLNEFFGTHLSTYRTRRAELVALGYIEDSGERVGDQGRKHVRWRVTHAGRARHLGLSADELPQAA